MYRNQIADLAMSKNLRWIGYLSSTGILMLIFLFTLSFVFHKLQFLVCVILWCLYFSGVYGDHGGAWVDEK